MSSPDRAASPYRALPVPHPDRVFMCQFALGTRWRYVDRILYTRTVHAQPGNLRLPDEQFNRLINTSNWGYSRTALALGPFLLGSGVAPWRRKIHVPWAVLGMAWSYRGLLYRGRLPLPLRLFFAAGRKTARLFR